MRNVAANEELVDVEEAEADQATVRFSLKVRILRPSVKGLESLKLLIMNTVKLARKFVELRCAVSENTAFLFLKNGSGSVLETRNLKEGGDCGAI